LSEIGKLPNNSKLQEALVYAMVGWKEKPDMYAPRSMKADTKAGVTVNSPLFVACEYAEAWTRSIDIINNTCLVMGNLSMGE